MECVIPVCYVFVCVCVLIRAKGRGLGPRSRRAAQTVGMTRWGKGKGPARTWSPRWVAVIRSDMTC